MSEYANIRKQIAELQKKAKNEAKKLFKEGSKSIFEKYPKLKSFSWTQYTPYFNDGDECHFSANTDYPTIVYDGNEYGECSDAQTEPTKESEAVEKDIVKFLQTFSDEDHKEIFGDHVQITVTKKKISTTNHGHE